ncbi:Stabilizer Of Axonemal Microtubules 2, partial [Manis pentadactyla]
SSPHTGGRKCKAVAKWIPASADREGPFQKSQESEASWPIQCPEEATMEQ